MLRIELSVERVTLHSLDAVPRAYRRPIAQTKRAYARILSLLPLRGGNIVRSITAIFWSGRRTESAPFACDGFSQQGVEFPLNHRDNPSVVVSLRGQRSSSSRRTAQTSLQKG